MVCWLEGSWIVTSWLKTNLDCSEDSTYSVIVLLECYSFILHGNFTFILTDNKVKVYSLIYTSCWVVISADFLDYICLE